MGTCKITSIAAGYPTRQKYEKAFKEGPNQLVLNPPLFIKPIPIWKRGIDIFGSLFGILMLSPLFLGIGIFIKIVSPGPIIFKQKRVGRGGKLFNLFKFRTMKINSDPEVHKQHVSELIDSSRKNVNPGNPMEKLSKDQRIIKCGNFMRASGMDELPQLMNVLRGEMSLIGPRPPIPYEAEQYQLWYNGRFDVLPGLTGLWQTSGKNKLSYNEMMRLDRQYAMSRSFLIDLKIFIRTPYAVYLQIKDMVKNL